MAGLTAVDLGWIDEDSYSSLSDLQKQRLSPGKVYKTAYYLLDPRLRASLSEPYADWMSTTRERYGPLFDEVVKPLADRFIADVNARGLAMPELEPPIPLTRYLERTGTSCRPE